MTEVFNKEKTVRLMFQDEAGFGRINKPKYCWCRKGIRPSVPCHHIREYRYAYGAVEPLTGDSFFYVMSHCDTVCMNGFLRELSKIKPEALTDDNWKALIKDSLTLKPMCADELCVLTMLPFYKVSKLLTELELNGTVCQEKGKYSLTFV